MIVCSKRFLPLYCKRPPTCGPIPTWRVTLSDTMSWFKGGLANPFTSGKVASGKSASGGKCAQLLFLSVSIMWDLKLLYLVYNTVKFTAAALSLLWRYLWKRVGTTLMLIKTATVLWWCVCMFGVIRRQRGMAAVKWAFCVVCLWAIKCQLLIPLLSREDLNRCTAEDELFQSGGKLSKGFSDIMRTRRWYMGQWGCCGTVLTFHYW